MHSRPLSARVALFPCGCVAVGPALFWSQWGWPGCVALIVAFQLLSLPLALVGWRPSRARPGHA